MKNKGTYILLTITAVFIAFSIGILVGRCIGGEKVYITLNAPTQAHTDALHPTHADTRKLNINTATVDVLCELPGIGQVLAENIIAYRNTNGPFTDITQLKNVDGIGDKIFTNICDLITVGG